MGLSFKMYANEAKGEKWPDMFIKAYIAADLDPASISIGLNFGPYVLDIYPEYMPDPHIIICPSDADGGEFRWIGEADPGYPLVQGGENYFGTYDSRFHSERAGCDHGGSCANSIDQSYAYVGYVMDKANDDDPIGIPGTWTSILLGLDDPSLLEGPAQTWALLEAVADGLADGGTGPGVQILVGGSTDPVVFNAFNAVTNGDLDVPDGYEPIEPDPYDGTLGNATGDTIFHLREGIERFFITDINNPGASARAQSEVFVMWDRISSNVVDFNHVPGGSNILYLDGHVAFQRFPSDEAPVQPGFARFDQTVNEGS
jgi:prepilin-type processing-associated H-X9-DG protein